MFFKSVHCIQTYEPVKLGVSRGFLKSGLAVVCKCAVVCCRLNEAPVTGFEKDVGSKTTMRITYPEGAIQKTERYETQSLFVLSAFKALDFKWLRHMIFNQRLVRQLEATVNSI